MKAQQLCLVYYVNGKECTTGEVMEKGCAQSYVRTYNSIRGKKRAKCSPAIPSDLLAHVHILFGVDCRRHH